MELIAVIAFVLVYFVREYVHYKENQDLMAERAELLNRIKPETAIIANVDMPELVDPVRSDEEYWQAHENQIKEEGTYPYGYDEEARGR